jgi:hypothetical protein
MKTCDFSRSFITFVTKNRSNNARIQVEARCNLLNQRAGESEDYYLVASCKGEETYGKGCLFLTPSYDFCMIYSSTEFMIIRTYANAERDNTTVSDNLVHFLDVHFHTRMVDAEVLEDPKAIVQAALANRILNGRVEITDESGRYRAVLEFPIKTMNVNDISNLYQADTGPILLPDFASTKERMVERFQLAFVAYNRDNEAYFVVHKPTPVTAGSSSKVSHYSEVFKANTRNMVIAMVL